MGLADEFDFVHGEAAWPEVSFIRPGRERCQDVLLTEVGNLEGIIGLGLF